MFMVAIESAIEERVVIGRFILTIIGSDNGLSPGRRQAIFWTNVGILSIEPLETNFSEIVIKIRAVLFKKRHMKMSSAKSHPLCIGLIVLNSTIIDKIERLL